MSIKRSKIISQNLSFINKEQWLSIIALGVSAVVSIFAAWQFKFGVGFFTSLVLATTASLIFDRINRHISENKTIQMLENLRQKIDDLECIGGITEGLDWIIRHMDGLQHVYNTVFTRSNEDYTSVNSENLQDYVETIRTTLDDGCQWSDIYGTSEKTPIAQFRSSLSDNQLKNYHSYEVPVEVPMFQYSVMRYKDGRRYVIFGWGFQGGQDDKAKVFVSKSKDTVDFFSDHFHALRRLSRRD